MTHLNSFAPLISVVIPAQKAQHLEETLNSLSMQSYRPLELIVADDDKTGAVSEAIAAFRALVDFPITHLTSETELGEFEALARCVAVASGEYVKFLNDDDVLEPACIETLASAMNAGEIVLASTKRTRIDQEGAPLPDTYATVSPFSDDVLINGKELVSFLAEYTINFIGELSAVMCRRRDLLDLIDEMPVLNGAEMHGWGDLALYVKLLRSGNLALLAKPLVRYREPLDLAMRSQHSRSTPLGVSDQVFGQVLKTLGWCRAFGDNALVQVAPITRLNARIYKPINLIAALQSAASFNGGAPRLWLEARRPTATQQALIEQRLVESGNGSTIAVIVLDRGADKTAVDRTLASLDRDSLYRNFVVTVLRNPAWPGGDTTASRWDTVGDIQAVVRDTSADWFMVVEAGATFTVSGLLIVALDLLGAPESCLAIYADEMIRLDNEELGHALRPDLNLDLLLSFPASMSRHWLYRRDAMQAFGGFNELFPQAFELDFQLRLIAQQGLGCVGHVSEPLLICDHPQLQDNPQERQVIKRHLVARGYPGSQVASRFIGRYDVDYGHHETPTVSIVIVAGKHLARVQRCLQTVLEMTSYRHYEVLLVAKEAGLAEFSDWLRGVEAMAVARIRVLRFGAEASQAQMRNQAAEQAQGDFLLFLGAGAGVMHRDWLQQLLNHGLRPEVGVVGGKLLRADGKVRNAGILLGLGGAVGYALEGESLDTAGYMSRLLVDQNHSAISEECLLVRRAVFVETGGFDEEPNIARWADTDFCLRLQQAGFLNVWTPRVQLLMDADMPEPASRAEESAMLHRWLPLLARDPAHNPCFSLDRGHGFHLSEPVTSWRPLEGWRPLPVVLGFPADSFGCGHYRMIQPFGALREKGIVDGALSFAMLDAPSLERFQPDVVLVQRLVSEARIEAIQRIKEFSRAFKVYELDDYLPGVPLKSIHRKDYSPNEMNRFLRRGLSYVDRFVVSTEPLAEALGHLHPDIRVMKNCLDPAWWHGLKSERRCSSKPRVGWAGGSSHTGDLEMIGDVVRELANEVEWVFFGMCPEKLRPYVHEFHHGVSIDQYPAALAKMNLDLALAPVEQNLFNECKSNLRLLEYGACGFAVVSSDVRCYQGDLPVTQVKNRYKDWVDAIRMHINDLDSTFKTADELRSKVLSGYMLEGNNLQMWREAWLPG
ncbi:glycosyltransferase [Pseudomonas sp. NPDC047961]